MPHDVVVDVVVPDVVPVVDVASVGVQGPPGEPGEPGPAGPPGPQGEPGDAAGPHAATHQPGGNDPITLLDASVLTGTVTTNVIAPLVTATTAVVVGATPAQSGAIRLGTGAEIMSRNPGNTGDLHMISDNGFGTIALGNSGQAVSVQTLRSAEDVRIGTNPAQTGALRLANDQPITARNGANTGNVEIGKIDASDFLQLGSGAAFVWPQAPLYCTNPVYLESRFRILETTAPGAAPANMAYIYLEDNGAGKSRLMIQFATGSPVQIAIQP